MNEQHQSTQGASPKRPLIIGLTGGIASGKSTVSRYLNERHQIPIIDTDVIARELVEVGKPTLTEIVAHFGADVRDEQGALKRRELRDIISQNPDERAWLNGLMHPKIYDEVMAQVKQLSASPHPYIIIVIPLLSSDSPYLNILSAVWVVDCEEERQKQHLIARDQMSATIAQQLIDAQPNREDRRQIATEVIANHADTDSLLNQAEQLHQHLIRQLSLNPL